MILSFTISDILCSISLSSPVNVPMGGHYEVYTRLEDRKGFTYANVRKASYTGIVSDNDKYSNYSDHQHDISVQVLDDWRSIPTYVC